VGVFAGYLYIVQERVGSGTRFTLNWAQGNGSIGTGPGQCYADRAPGEATFVVSSSDDSGPYVPDTVENCSACSCNNQLNGKVDYRCLSAGTCQYCPPCPSGCGFGETCDTSAGTCNSQCVCDTATCTGSYCVGDDVYTYGCSGNSCVGSYSKTCQTGCVNVGSGSVYYSGCSNGACDSGTSYDCPNCQNKYTNSYTQCVCVDLNGDGKYQKSECTDQTYQEQVCPGQETQGCTVSQAFGSGGCQCIAA